jgi:hypothetical protein
MKLKLMLVAVSLSFSTLASASPVTLDGNFIRTAVNDVGTLGSGGNTSPGLLYDKTGTANFSDNNDYLTPGDPYDYFGVKSTETGLIGNANSFGSNPIVAVSGPTNLSSGSVNSASWTGEYAGFFNIVNTYTFNDDSQRIDVSTTITALQNLTNVQFARSIDPDPDVNTFGSYFTENSLGNAALGLAPTDWAYSLGTSTGLPLGLYTNSVIEHNAGIVGSWGGTTSDAADPSAILAGINDGNGDYALALGFNIGSILAGQSIKLDYSYVMGLTKDTVDVPDVSNVPVPGAVWLFGSAIAGFFGFGRRKQA